MTNRGRTGDIKRSRYCRAALSYLECNIQRSGWVGVIRGIKSARRKNEIAAKSGCPTRRADQGGIDKQFLAATKGDRARVALDSYRRDSNRIGVAPSGNIAKFGCKIENPAG